MRPWKTLDRRTRYQNDHYLTVEEHTIELPDGKIIENWPWIVSYDYIIALPVTPLGQMLLFQQTKYGVEGLSLAMVGGYIEPGEEPLTAAQREVLEETGCQAAKWVSLGSYRVDGNRGNGIAHLFLALGAIKVQEVEADDLEEQELVQLSQAEVAQALAKGQFKVLAWALDAALALQYLKGQES